MSLLGRLAVLGSVLLPTVIAGFDPASSGNVAAYWGQNSYNQGAGPLAQQSLGYYCANSDIDIIPIAFMLGIKTPRVNFANQEAGCQPIAGSSLIYCPAIETDIKACQTKYGKKILLSLGGDSYTEGGFASSAEAITNANNLWAMFGPSTTAATPRPFGTAVIDGFDFDFESQASNLVPFAQQIRLLAKQAAHTILITAAPQCPYPDAAVGELLASSVSIDAIFVQFYNNYCGLSSFVAGAPSQNNFNLASWDTWARTVSANKDVKVLIGVPGNIGGAGSGYISASALKAVTNYASQYSSFGGVMMWDVSQLYSNTGFLSSVSAALGALPDAPSVPALVSVVTPVAVVVPVVPIKAVPAPTPTPAATPPTSGTLVDTPVLHSPKPNIAALAPVVPVVSAIKAIPTPAALAPVSGVLVQEWNQCGGIGYTGPTQCAAGLICTKGGSEWWYSCKTPGALWKA